MRLLFELSRRSLHLLSAITKPSPLLTQNRYGLDDSAGLAAGVEPWISHQLRHSFATEVAERYQSLEKAAAGIGDTEATAAKHYVHLDPRERARKEIAAEMGRSESLGSIPLSDVAGPSPVIRPGQRRAKSLLQKKRRAVAELARERLENRPDGREIQ